MEKYLFIALLILLVSLTISFIIFITDYFGFRKRIERILDLNIEGNNNTQKVINITESVNDSVREVCISNNILIKKLLLVTKENNYLRQTIISNKENNEK